MRSSIGLALLFLLTLTSASYSQKMEFMQDMPEGDAKVTSRKVMVVIKNESISSVAIIDRDGDVSMVEPVSQQNKNVMVEIPVGKTYIISTFQNGVKTAQEKKLISVSENGAVSFGTALRSSSDGQRGNTDPTGTRTEQRSGEAKSQTVMTLEKGETDEKKSVVRIKTKMTPVPSSAGSYVVSVTNDGLTETIEVPFEIKEATIISEKDLDVSLRKGKSVITIYPRLGSSHLKDNAPKVEVDCANCSRETTSGREAYKRSNSVQAYFGTEIVGASSASSQAQPFFNIKLWLPIRYAGSCRNFTLNRRCLAFWADFRFASSASQTLPNFASISGPTASGFFANNQSSNLNQLVRSFQTKIGLEYGVGRNTSLIIGGGITSPLSATQSVQAYKIPRTGPNSTDPVTAPFQAVFGNIDYTNLNTLILKSGERDRFQRNWFLGGRVRYDIFGDENVSPAEVDLTFGQDEAITRKLSGFVMKFDATIPIKIADKQVLYFGAGYNLRLTRNVNTISVPFFLEPTASYNLFGNTNLVKDFDQTPFGTATRDTYSFRVGVDILRLIFGNKDGESNTAPDATADNLTRQKQTGPPLAGPSTPRPKE